MNLLYNLKTVLYMIMSYLSSPVMVNKISFALGWVLVIAMASWPGSLAIQIVMTILSILFIITAILCAVTHGKLLILSNDISRNKLVNISLCLAWFVGFVFAGFSDPLVKESICNAATVILITGLLFYPSTGGVSKPEGD